MQDNIYLNEIAVKLKYRIAGSDDYGWKCYGDDCRIMDFGDNNDPYHISVIFDPISMEVREITGHGRLFTLINDSPWRWIHTEYVDRYINECSIKRIPIDKAWDDVNYISIDIDEAIRLIDMAK